jgi:hypothetical protein
MIFGILVPPDSFGALLKGSFVFMLQLQNFILIGWTKI